MSAAGPVHFAILLRELLNGPQSKSTLREATGLHHVTIARYVAALHRQRVIRIEEYRRGGNRAWVPFYVVNADGLPDEIKPDAKPDTEIDRHYRARQKMRQTLRRMAG